jgi:broad specificity phosphatase PhoE
MTEVTLARHGETEWNVAEIFRGRIDIGLSQNGQRQAELLGEYLSRCRLEAVYSSPLRRALETAEVVAGRHKMGVATAAGLIDLDYGQWQGLSQQEVKEKYGELYQEWHDHPERVRMPSGESLDDVRQRALEVVSEAARYEGRVILVSHRVVNKVLICALLGLDNSHFWNIKQDTGAITTFAHDRGRFVLTEHNNTSYLSPLGKKPLGDF